MREQPSNMQHIELAEVVYAQVHTDNFFAITVSASLCSV
jgi:hypothetical protein